MKLRVLETVINLKKIKLFFDTKIFGAEIKRGSYKKYEISSKKKAVFSL